MPEEFLKVEKEIMTKWFDYFQKNKLVENHKNKLLTDIITIFLLEESQLGYDCLFPNNQKITLEDEKSFSSSELKENDKVFNVIFAPLNELGYLGLFSLTQPENELNSDNPNITFYMNSQEFLRILRNEDNSTRKHCIQQLFLTILHEKQHHSQYEMTQKDISSLESIRYARDFVLMKYPPVKDFYAKNYSNFYTEINAELVTCYKYNKLFPGSYNVNKIERQNERNFKMGVYYDPYDKIGFRKQRDDVAISVLDNLICNQGKVDILSKFPILQKEYNLDGTKKSGFELIKNMQNETKQLLENKNLSDDEKDKQINDAQIMYYELIYNALQNSSKKEIGNLVSKIGRHELSIILNNMSQYFKGEITNRSIYGMNTSVIERYYNQKIEKISKIKEQVSEIKLTPPDIVPNTREIGLDEINNLNTHIISTPTQTKGFSNDKL